MRTPMTPDDALQQFRIFALERALGRQVGSDRLIQAGLDGLVAGVESPSLVTLAGLRRREEPEASEHFDRVLEELGLFVDLPSDPRAANWAIAYGIAGRIADGSLDPAVGTHLIWADIAHDLDWPEELQPLVASALDLEDWQESWGVGRDVLTGQAVEAAEHLLSRQSPGERND